MNHTQAIPAALLLCFSHSALAQTETELPPVVVTANRIARTADETLASVTVITRQEIERQQAQSLPDLLRGLPGIQLTNNGGPGKVSSLFLRGTNDGHTLVLIDGVKFGSATNGDSSLQDIPVDIIERIEIVRGPLASLYGSEAIGGVIQVFTRRSVQAPTFVLGAGSHGSYQASAAGGLGSSSAWLNMAASGFSTRGINVKDGGSPAEPDRDGYTRGSIDLHGGIQLAETLSLDAQALHTEGRNKYDGTPNLSDFTQELFANTLRFIPGENYTGTLRLAQSLDASNNFKDETFNSRFDTHRDQLSWQNDIKLGKGQQIVAGIDYEYDKIISSTLYDRNRRSNKAAFAQYLFDLGGFDAQLAARHDKNEQFGHHNTGSIAAGYTFSPALRVFSSYGTAFKAPSFNDLYWPDAGNPNLAPEKSRSSEVGVTGKSGGFAWQTSFFRTHISNLIAWAPVSPGSWVWIPSNVSQAQISGLELSASQTIGNTRIAANISFLNPKDRSGGTTEGNILVRRARQSGRLDIDHDFGTWRLGGSIEAIAKRYDDAANTIKLGGYATLDLRAEYAIDPSWRIQTRIENLLDKRYQTAYGYNQMGFGAYLSVRYTPK